MEHLDCLVIGGGVVGLAIGRALGDSVQVFVLERNRAIGLETSSRNSGVIHAGIHSPPGFLKSRLCVEGRHLLYDYCRQNQISFSQCGKLVIASQPEQRPCLQQLLHNAVANSITDCTLLDRQQLAQREPEVCGEMALFSPSSGIIDVAHYVQQLAVDIENRGGHIGCQQAVTAIEITHQGFIVRINDREEIVCRQLVNAAGLGAQAVASMLPCTLFDHALIPALHPCKGQYFCYQGRTPFHHLVYPLPDTAKGGLGIHATLDLGHQLRFGPDAHYVDSLDYSVSANSKEEFLLAIRHYYPMIDSSRLTPDFAGIRPKLSAAGEPARDFLIQTEEQHGIRGLVNLFGIESPGLTASLAIGNHVKALLCQ